MIGLVVANISYLVVDDVPELHGGEDGEDLCKEGDAEEGSNQGNQKPGTDI
jgi:hypothetical protein